MVLRDSYFGSWYYNRDSGMIVSTDKENLSKCKIIFDEFLKNELKSIFQKLKKIKN